MAEQLSRRQVLGMAAGAVAVAAPGSHWIFALNGKGRIVRAAAQESAPAWTPLVMTPGQAEAAAAVCEAIIPETDTPGARQARVHEFIDLELSVSAASEKDRFLSGLQWLEEVCREQSKKGLAEASAGELADLLSTVSDEIDSHPADRAEGVAFFKDIKSRTIFGYYTSREGRVEELGLPAAIGMEQWQGCTDPGGH